ncbi:MAG: 1-deoxy-D-xylulose-5-phosphate reductoisomerase [Thermodesulfovibrionales bacterium]|nr:1-deoxy-D-xylulose-5-phosphate reductoisomerase [Thermodesulfovibrionales bacterium]
MKNIVILGSTGSIGRNALEVISKFQERFRVVGLAAGKNISLLAEQIKKFQPKVVAVSDEKAYRDLKSEIQNTKYKIQNLPEMLSGTDGICAVASMLQADIILSSIVGSAGLLPTIAAIRAGKTIALANKETLVTAGEMVMSMAEKHNAHILPVDSEHSALFQCLEKQTKDNIKKLILTASGGPFINMTAEDLNNVSPREALNHPNWSMGRKITIDSATLMNKGLEVIEAYHLFNMPVEKIDVLIHPQSIIHSIVEFKDGSYLAQLSMPDMKAPIAYALSYPERLANVIEPINWEEISGLTFKKPDTKTFPCLSFAYDAIEAGGTMPAVLNASNEIAVAAFLGGVIGFSDIPVIIKKVMDVHKLQPADDINTILEADGWARRKTQEELNK